MHQVLEQTSQMQKNPSVLFIELLHNISILFTSQFLQHFNSYLNGFAPKTHYLYCPFISHSNNSCFILVLYSKKHFGLCLEFQISSAVLLVLLNANNALPALIFILPYTQQLTFTSLGYNRQLMMIFDALSISMRRKANNDYRLA